jgi:uncharacterized protein
MKLNNEITVPATVEEAWDVMLDVGRIAPCLPGAAIEEGDGESWKGTMKVKIGPITAAYEGTIKIAEADEQARRAVLQADARDSRGRGGASATITSTMAAVDEGTKIDVETDLRVTGPAAQFGRGVMQDVSAKMMDRFADCLATKMGGPDEAPAEAPAQGAADEQGEPAASGAVPGAAALPDDVPDPPSPPAAAPAEPADSAPPPEQEALDLAELSRGAVAKRVLPLVAGTALAVGALLLVRRRRR